LAPNTEQDHQQPAKRKGADNEDDIPQYDGADEIQTLELSQATEISFDCTDGASNQSTDYFIVTTSPGAENNDASRSFIPQLDGADGGSSEEKDEPSAKRSRGEDIDELNSDLDDDDEDALIVEDETATDLALCQYEKVSRVRTRWRGILRAGIIHIGRSDYCFSRANIDFDW
jgi:transcription initiation factor TFIIA large subunit